MFGTPSTLDDFESDLITGQTTATGQWGNTTLRPMTYDLSIMNVDVEGHEAAVFRPLLNPERQSGHWPDYIMMEAAWSEQWDYDVVAALKEAGYREHFKTKLNMILTRD